MEHLSKILQSKNELFDKLCAHNVKVTLKIDGAAFQITCDNGEITYHKRSGSTNKPGPVIDEFTLLYSRHLHNAIQYFNNRKEEISKYRFLTFEIFNDKYILLSAVKDDSVIEDIDELEKIASELNVDTVPVIFNGILTEEQQAFIKSYHTTSEDVPFNQFLKSTFNVSAANYNKYLKNDDEIEGIVLNFDVDGKNAQYKIVDKAFTNNVKKKNADDLALKEKNKETAEKITLSILDWMENNSQKLDDNHWESLNKNFYNMVKDAPLMNKLLNLSVRLNESKFKPVESLLKPEIKKLIKKHGTAMAIIYENYLMMFHKKRTRHYIINKDTQNKINKVIESI